MAEDTVRTGFTLPRFNLDFNDLIVNKSASAFKMLATASTYAEVQNLASIAIRVRDEEFLTAWLRFGIIGITEVLVTLWFIEIFVNSMKRASEDHKIKIGEVFKILMVSAPVALFGFTVTSYIHRLYFEATGNVEAQYWAQNWFTELYPIFGSYLETDCYRFIHSSCEDRHRIESSAVFLIYYTPLNNLLLVVFYSMSQVRKNREKFANMPNSSDSDDEPDSSEDSDGSDENDDTSEPPSNDLLNSRVRSIKDIAGYIHNAVITFNNDYATGQKITSDFTESELVKFILATAGVNYDTQSFQVYSVTDPKVKKFIEDESARGTSSAMSPEDKLRNMSNKFLGRVSDAGGISTGVNGLKHLFTKISDRKKELEAAEKELTEARDKYAETNSQEDSRAVQDAEANVTRIESSIKDTVVELEDSLNIIISNLEDLNFFTWDNQ